MRLWLGATFLAVTTLAAAISLSAGCSSSSNKSCNDNGVTHASGTMWTCNGGCNSCSCDNGQTSTTLAYCGEPDAGQALSCNDNGVIRPSGTMWQCSCNTCSCDNGSMSTTLIDCEEVDASIYDATLVTDGEAGLSEPSG